MNYDTAYRSAKKLNNRFSAEIFDMQIVCARAPPPPYYCGFSRGENFPHACAGFEIAPPTLAAYEKSPLRLFPSSPHHTWAPWADRERDWAEAAPIKCDSRESGRLTDSLTEIVGKPADSLLSHFIGAASGGASYSLMTKHEKSDSKITVQTQARSFARKVRIEFFLPPPAQ